MKWKHQAVVAKAGAPLFRTLIWPPSLTGRFPAEIDLLVQSVTLEVTPCSGSLEPQALKLTWISGELARK